MYIYVYLCISYVSYVPYVFDIAELNTYFHVHNPENTISAPHRQPERIYTGRWGDDVSTVLFFTASNRSRPPVADVHPGVELDESPGEIYWRACPVQSPVGVKKYILKICTCPYINVVIEGSLEVKLPAIWTDEKQSREEAERKERVEERRSEKRKSQKKVDADARKGRKVAKHCVFPMIWGSGGSKSRLAKAADAQTSEEMRDEKLHAVVARSRFRSEKIQNTSAPDHFWKLRCWKSALWREAHLEVKCVKNWGVRSSFGNWDVEKVHGIVARSTFGSKMC